MRSRYPVFSMLCAIVLLSGCVPVPFTTPDRTPTIGPVQIGRVDPDAAPSIGLSMELTTNTNCAEVGEVVTFTARIHNNEVRRITLKGSPPLDIILSLGPPESIEETELPVRRWSETPAFPQSFDPVLQPGELRTYQWSWTAEQVFYPNPDRPGNGVWISFYRGAVVSTSGGSRPAGALIGYMGVGKMDFIAGPDSSIPCAELRRP
jgi:hypothetical protein